MPFLPMIQRREFLRVGALPLLGLGLPQLLQGRDTIQTQTALGRAKACIVLFMWGGPAQQDTWDLKPDAPAEYRGEFQTDRHAACPALRDLRTPAATCRAGRPARRHPVDDARRRRSHDGHALPADRPRPANRAAPIAEDWPNYGAVLAHLGRGRGPLPPFVSMMPVGAKRRAALRRGIARPGGRLARPAVQPLAHRRRRQQARLPRRRIRLARRVAGRRAPAVAATCSTLSTANWAASKRTRNSRRCRRTTSGHSPCWRPGR